MAASTKGTEGPGLGGRGEAILVAEIELLLLVAESREHEDRNGLRGANLTTNLATIHTWQEQIEHDQVDRL